MFVTNLDRAMAARAVHLQTMGGTGCSRDEAVVDSLSNVAHLLYITAEADLATAKQRYLQVCAQAWSQFEVEAAEDPNGYPTVAAAKTALATP